MDLTDIVSMASLQANMVPLCTTASNWPNYQIRECACRWYRSVYM